MSQTPDRQPESLQPDGVSLNELSEAFAQAMGVEPEAAADPQSPSAESAAGQPVPVSDERPPQHSAEAEVETPAEEDDSCEISPRTILEAMLFVGNRDGQPISARRAAELMRGVEPAEIAELVDDLNRRYAANGCPYHVVSDGSGYRLVLCEAFHPLRNRFYGRIREARLSQAAIDVLAIVAYQQPLSSEQIGRLRGKASGHMLAQLVRRGLLRIERKEGKRRIAQYCTTDRFLRLFGLEGLDDLPQSEDLEGQ
ncbi:MAG: SMC-Scp complex subunit ScpB [Planctomycetota bacterium]|jgi:segregation and condensation protein B